jgi:flagellar basal-body rod protein FlgB
MNLVSQRQDVVASNIANANTPGCKTPDSQSSFRSAPDGSLPEAVQVTWLKTRNDGNNVGLDRNAMLLAGDVTRFSVTSNLLHSTNRRKEAIQEGIRI